ncbi:MAG: M48 family metallopeptidase [Candidatus Accumulibacter sp.]|nr:M48 family metallopeptidase [Accumulibacter sp.]
MESVPLQPDLFSPSGNPALSGNESMHAIAIKDRIVPYVLRRSSRGTIVLSIDHRGLRVGAPRRETLAGIEMFILKHERWVARKLDEWRASRRSGTLRIAEGSDLPLLGGNLRVHLACGDNRVDWGDPFPSTVTLFLRSPRDAAAVLEKSLRERARDLFAERLARYAERLEVDVPPLAISNARTRWGCCSLKTGIRLNWRLLHFPLRLIDYVVVHELAHLREMNHGKRFWAIVGGALPEYRALREELKELAVRLPRDFSAA